MMRGAILIFSYIALLVMLGLYADRVKKRSSEDYFLASRGFRTILLFFTMTATNFSAFFFLGFPDSAYKLGFGWYGAMALGTYLTI
jgi:SSS family solute:Na+ symporter